MIRLGKQIVHQYVVRPLKRTARQIVEARRHAFIAGQVDSRNNLERAGRGDLRDHRSHALTWGSFASTPPILIGIGAPENALINEDPGGRTSTSAPMPAVRVRLSCSIPATDHDQQNHRNFQRNRHHADQRAQGPMHQIPDDHPIHHVVSQHTAGRAQLLALAVRLWRVGIRPVEPHHFRPRRLFQRKLVVGQRFIDFQFDHVQRDVVILRGRSISIVLANIVPA